MESGLNQRDRAESAASPTNSFVKTTGIFRFLGCSLVVCCGCQATPRRSHDSFLLPGVQLSISRRLLARRTTEPHGVVWANCIIRFSPPTTDRNPVLGLGAHSPVRPHTQPPRRVAQHTRHHTLLIARRLHPCTVMLCVLFSSSFVATLRWRLRGGIVLWSGVDESTKHGVHMECTWSGD